ncbi:unnamed protein product [Rhodiola kirilowii]
MPSYEEDQFPSTPGKVKIERTHYHGFSRQFGRFFSSTTTMLIWTLFLIALTTSFLSFQTSVHTGKTYFAASWADRRWEKDVHSSAQIQRSHGMFVLVTGAAGFVKNEPSLLIRLFSAYPNSRSLGYWFLRNRESTWLLRWRRMVHVGPKPSHVFCFDIFSVLEKPRILKINITG